MSTKTNRAKLKKACNNRAYLAIQYNINYPLYWDECCTMYPQQANGWAKSSGKQILPYQVRMYKTWKHTRKKQWKE